MKNGPENFAWRKYLLHKTGKMARYIIKNDLLPIITPPLRAETANPMIYIIDQ